MYILYSFENVVFISVDFLRVHPSVVLIRPWSYNYIQPENVSDTGSSRKNATLLNEHNFNF